jgi:hypothetical protein
MRGRVILADVRLELHDPRTAAAGLVVADERGSQERLPGGEGRACEDGPVDDVRWRQRNV